MIAIAPTINPPAPRPCTPRKPISSPMFWDNPVSADPARNATIDAMNTPLRP
jgi:hypothetical protein